MTDDELERLLDVVSADQQAAAAQLAQGLQEHVAWQELKHELLVLAAQQGKDVATMAIPLLAAALKAALV